MYLFDGAAVGDLDAGQLERAGAMFGGMRSLGSRSSSMMLAPGVSSSSGGRGRGRGRRIRRKLRRTSRRMRRSIGVPPPPQVIVIRQGGDDDQGYEDGSDGLVHIGSLPASYGTWNRPQVPEWEPRGIGDFRSSEVYGRSRGGAYMGEAIPSMVGDLSLKPTWGMQDDPQWDPRGIGDFRTSQVYSGTGTRRYQGEALPMMVGGLGNGMVHVGSVDQSGIAFMLGAARRRRMQAEAAQEAEDLNQEASEGMMLIAGPSIGFIY